MNLIEVMEWFPDQKVCIEMRQVILPPVRAPCYQPQGAMIIVGAIHLGEINEDLNHLREDIKEVKSEIRQMNQNFIEHLERHNEDP